MMPARTRDAEIWCHTFRATGITALSRQQRQFQVFQVTVDLTFKGTQSEATQSFLPNKRRPGDVLDTMAERVVLDPSRIAA